MNKKNVIVSKTLENYEKKYKNRKYRLLKYSKKDVDAFDKSNNTKGFLLKDRKWVLVKDMYYEIPKAPRLTWFRNLSAGVQASICLLGAGVVATSVAVPLTLINANKVTPTIKPFSKEDIKIDPEFAEQVTVTEAKTDEEGNDVIVFTANSPDQYVSAVTATDQNNVVLTASEVNYVPASGTLTIPHATVVAHSGGTGGNFAICVSGSVDDRPDAQTILISNVEGVNSVAVGGKLHFKASVAPSIARQDVTWSIFEKTTNIIDPNTGEFTANEKGEFIIVATSKSKSGISHFMPITVTGEGEITIDLPENKNILLGSEIDIEASVKGTSKTVTWSLADNQYISKISESGNKIKLKGDALTPNDGTEITLTASIEDENVSATCKLKVKIIILDEYILNMRTGDQKSINFYLPSEGGYYSYNMDIEYDAGSGFEAYLDENNYCIQIYNTSPTYGYYNDLNIKYNGEYVETLKIKVLDKKSISFDETSINIPVSLTEPYLLTLTNTIEEEDEVSFQIEDEDVATYEKVNNHSVKITPVSEGTTKIIATCEGCDPTECVINVTPAYTEYLEFDVITDENNGETSYNASVKCKDSSKIPATLTIPDKVSGICVKGDGVDPTKEYNITKIPFNAFNGVNNLQTLDLAENTSLKEIEKNAFSNCSSLQQVNFNNGLETIGDEAFMNSFNNESGLVSITIPSSVTNIGASAFADAKIGSISFDDKKYWNVKNTGTKITESELEEGTTNATNLTFTEGDPSPWLVNGLEKISNKTKFLKRMDEYITTFKGENREFIKGDLTIKVDGTTELTNSEIVYDVYDSSGKKMYLKCDQLTNPVDLSANSYSSYLKDGSFDDDCFKVPTGTNTISYINSNDTNYKEITINDLGLVEKITVNDNGTDKTIEITYPDIETHGYGELIYDPNIGGGVYSYSYDETLVKDKTFNLIIKCRHDSYISGYINLWYLDESEEEQRFTMGYKDETNYDFNILFIKDKNGNELKYGYYDGNWYLDGENKQIIIRDGSSDDLIISVKANESAAGISNFICRAV